MRVGGRGVQVFLPTVPADNYGRHHESFRSQRPIAAEGLSACSRGCGREEAYSVLMYSSAIAKVSHNQKFGFLRIFAVA